MFFPSDAVLTDYSSQVPWTEIQNVLSHVNALKVMFIDTCRSAHVFDRKVINDAYQSRVAVFSSAGPQQDALEGPEFGHGLFTYAILEGLKGAADKDGDDDGAVLIHELGPFVWKRVKKLSNGAQQPKLDIHPDVPNFPLARLK